MLFIIYQNYLYEFGATTKLFNAVNVYYLSNITWILNTITTIKETGDYKYFSGVRTPKLKRSTSRATELFEEKKSGMRIGNFNVVNTDTLSDKLHNNSLTLGHKLEMP